MKIKIVQLGTEYAILFDQSTPRKVTQEGEEFLLTVTSNVANEPTIEADMEGWVEIIEQPIVTRFLRLQYIRTSRFRIARGILNLSQLR